MKERWLRSVFGLGPIGGWRAGGTWASLVTVILVWFLPAEALLPSTVVLSLVGLAACRPTVKTFGVWDPGWFVWDEVCGMMISVLWIPLTWQRLALGFVLFRLFDIVKPPPARALERLHGGFGVMLDDVMAGIYVQIALRLGIAYAHL